jgi:hypothetical protein
MKRHNFQMASLLAMAAISMAPGTAQAQLVDQATDRMRRKYTPLPSGTTPEIKAHNAAVEAKKAAKLERKRSRGEVK